MRPNPRLLGETKDSINIITPSLPSSAAMSGTDRRMRSVDVGCWLGLCLQLGWMLLAVDNIGRVQCCANLHWNKYNSGDKVSCFVLAHIIIIIVKCRCVLRYEDVYLFVACDCQGSMASRG